MTAQDLLDAINRMIHDNLIQPDSLIVVRTAWEVGEGIEMAIEKQATRIVAAEPKPGQRIVKIMGF